MCYNIKLDTFIQCKIVHPRRKMSLQLRLLPSFAQSERSMYSSLLMWKLIYAAVTTWPSTSAKTWSWANANSKCFSPLLTILQYQMRWYQSTLRSAVWESEHRAHTWDRQKESASSLLSSRRSWHAQSPTLMAHKRGSPTSNLSTVYGKA